ncbi:MAG TPA: hypothetical protein VGB53_00370 [Rubricoccaceae bacterium]|jgi:hypothetical protein
MRPFFAASIALFAVLALAIVEPAAAAVVDVVHGAALHLAHASPESLFEPATLGAFAFAPFALPRNFGPRFDPENVPGPAAAPPMTQEDREAMVRGKFSDASPEMQRRLADLLGQVARTEVERDTARTELATYKTRVPEGSVVLTGDDAKAYATLKAREGAGETPIKAAADALAQAGTASQELTTLRRGKTLQDIAAAEKAAGVNVNVDLLEQYVPGLDVALVDQTVDGKTVKRGVVNLKDATTGAVSQVPLMDHLKAAHAGILPVLTGAPSTGGQQQPAGGTWPAQPTAPAGGTSAPLPAGRFDVAAHVDKVNATRSGKPATPAATPAA